MSIDVNDLIFRAREQVTGLPESVEFPRDAVRAVIPSAIAVWQERTAADPEKRQNFIRESDPIVIDTDGVADIEEQVNAKGFRLEFINASDIELTYSADIKFSVKFVNSLDRFLMQGRQDAFFIKAYQSGPKIRFRQPSGLPIEADLVLRSVVLPSDLEDMNASILPELATIVAEILKKRFYNQNRGLDIQPK